MSETKLPCITHENYTQDQIIDEALKQLRHAGFKNTKRRRELLEIFAADHRYHTATWVHEQMAQHNPTLSYNTIYRNIYDFVKIGLLTQTEFNQEQHFRLSCWHCNQHHHYFICTTCGQAIPLDACPMTQVSSSLTDVEITSHRFEVFGTCKNCLQKDSHRV